MVDPQQVLEKVRDYIIECQPTFFKLAAMKNLSPVYNKNWEADGEFIKCFNYMIEYINSLNISGLENLQIFQETGVTPSLFFTVSPSEKTETYTILFYSHIDKIPFGDGWTRCDPNDPKIIDRYLYGRGVATSTYSIFTILGMLKAMEELSIPRPRIVVLMESCFESGSIDLVTHLEKVNKIVSISSINQVVCLDTWGATYKYYHYMKSCRGSISFDVKITTGQKAVHSGSFGGLIPDPMMIFNNILSNRIEKIEKSDDGLATNIKIPTLETEITETQKEECKDVCDKCGFEMMSIFSYEQISQLIGSKEGDIYEDENYLTAYINGVLRPSYSILGFEDMPDVENASGSLKPYISARLFFRTPPSLDVNNAKDNLIQLILDNPPFGAKIEILNEKVCQGIDLEGTNNNMTEKMINRFSYYTDDRLGNPAVGLRLARTLPCLNFLTSQFKDVPIFMTGAGNTNTDNPRDANECIDINRVISFSSCLACYISDFGEYKE